jgi:type II secretory pathway component PulM
MSKLWTRAWTAFQNLSARERLLVGSAGGVVLLGILWFGVVMPLLGASARVSARADAAEQQLAAMSLLRR